MSRNLRSTANVKHAYFADQLHTSLLAKNVPTNPVGLAVALNAHLNATVVKPHTVRKWLLGETLPRSGALLQLANWLNIKPEELISKPRTLANKASI